MEAHLEGGLGLGGAEQEKKCPSNVPVSLSLWYFLLFQTKSKPSAWLPKGHAPTSAVPDTVIASPASNPPSLLLQNSPCALEIHVVPGMWFHPQLEWSHMWLRVSPTRCEWFRDCPMRVALDQNSRQLHSPLGRLHGSRTLTSFS